MKVPLRADLHIHTSSSDGAHPAQQVIDRAAASLSLISICDHDTMAAYQQQLQIPDHLELLPGIEMTCQVGESDLHMLAYFPSGLTGEILQWAKILEDDRRGRVFEGIEKLRESGIPLRWKDLEQEIQDSVPCRSHVARALVRGQLCAAPSQAYRTWLGKDAFRRPRLTVQDAFATVHSLGGLNFWAHPFAPDIQQHGSELIEAGLDGIESLYRNLGPSHRKEARAFQQKHQLGISGGSDLHQETEARKIGQYSVEISKLDERLCTRRKEGLLR